MISLEEVKNLAYLARIELDKKESEELQKELGAILDYVSKLKEAPDREIKISASAESKTPEIFSARGGSALGGNVFREDEPIIDDSDVEKGEHVKVKHIL